MLVDGYNMIAFWQSTKEDFKRGHLDQARTKLLSSLSNYASFEDLKIICVFDAHHVPGVRQRYDQYKVTVVFTEEDETADSYIEGLSAQLNQANKLVTVATSDLNEQWVVFSQGALRLSARELEERVQTVKKDVDGFVTAVDRQTPRRTPWSRENYQVLQDMMEEIDE